MTDEQKPLPLDEETLRRAMRQLGSRGGLKTKRTSTAQQRTERARKAAAARWNETRRPK